MNRPVRSFRPGLVSIVLPCFNSERYLQATLDSVLAQTYSNWELLAVDDASRDGTLALLERVAASEPRIRILRRDHSGGRPSVTKNHALPHCRGEFIALLDHDDLFLPDKLTILVDLLRKRPEAVAAFGDARFIDENGHDAGPFRETFVRDAVQELTPIAGIADAWLTREGFWRFQVTRYAAMVTVTVLIAPFRMPEGSTVDFDERYTMCDDADLWVRLGRAGPLAYLRRDVALYRVHPHNTSGNSLKLHIDSALLRDRYDALYGAGLSPEERKQLRHRRASTVDAISYLYRMQGQHGPALRAAWRSLCISPSVKRMAALLKAWLPARHHPAAPSIHE